MISALDPYDDLHERVRLNYISFRRNGWLVAMDVATVTTNAIWQTWGYLSERAWIQTEMPVIFKNRSHFKAIGQFALSLPESEREQWFAHPVWAVISGHRLLKRDPQALLAQLDGGADTESIRQAAREDPDMHLETEWRTIKLRVSATVYELWERALNRARYEACKAIPTPDDLVECISLALISEPLSFPPHVAIPTNIMEISTWHDAVHAGLVRCKKCGSWDRTRLTWHHTVARSSQGHESVQVPLCLPCHDEIQPHWREWLVKWGLEDQSCES